MPLTATLRSYSPADRDACLGIFDSNVPDGYVLAHERSGYASFLDALPGPYFVLEDGEVVACGGFALHTPDPHAVTMCWGMVTCSRHKRGLGRFLLEERLRRVRSNTSAQFAVVNTSQLACGFFAKMQFATVRVVPDGITPGLDLHEMHLPLRDLPRHGQT
jgi:hypothetical protein